MKVRAIAASRRGRWALSFADLSLLLLGFFVLLHASAGRQQEIVGGVAEQFGANVGKTDRLVAAELFQPGEALLSEAGSAKLSALARLYARNGKTVEIRSVGLDKSANRFDNWDLAAARLGAVARALVAGGMKQDRVSVRGLDQQIESKGGQVLALHAR